MNMIFKIARRKEKLSIGDYIMTRDERKTIYSLRKLLNDPQYKIEDIYEILRRLEGKLNPSKLRIMKYYFRGVKRSKPLWTLRDLAHATALFKKGPKAYNFLVTCFPLPSRDNIRRVLQNIPIHTGLNEYLLKKLSERVSKFNRFAKTCSILFKEIVLAEETVLDKERNKIVGYVDLGSLGCRNVQANRALVFMANGIHSKWKQPIAYYFIQDTMEVSDLKHLLIEVISAVQGAGLEVIATICVHQPSNQAVIEDLCYSNQTNKSNYYFKVNNKKIFCLFDPCHLLKSTRDALFKYDIEYESTKVAKSQYIEKSYWYDQKRRFQISTKIQKGFIYLEQYPQFRENVCAAASTMSYKVAYSLNLWVELGKLPGDANDTRDFIFDINKLFDSFNGSNAEENEAATYRRSISSRSLHFELWRKLLPTIRSWAFISKDGKTRQTEHPIKSGWLRTIKATEELWRDCRRKGFVCLHTRSLNLDPLDNLFAAIRYFKPNSFDPNCYQFIACFQSSILSDLKIKNLQSNCQEDDAIILIESKLLLNGNEKPKSDLFYEQNKSKDLVADYKVDYSCESQLVLDSFKFLLED